MKHAWLAKYNSSSQSINNQDTASASLKIQEAFIAIKLSAISSSYIFRNASSALSSRYSRLEAGCRTLRIEKIGMFSFYPTIHASS